MIGSTLRKLAAVLAVALALGMLTTTADARAGGGFSAGSRGSRTFSAPPSTSTAPSVSPMQRSVTQPTRPGTVGSAPAAGGFFSRPGLLGGLAAGFLGAGLFGMLFGHGLFGGLGGFASFFGLILQIGLVLIIGRFLWNMWQRRQQPAYAGAGAPMVRDAGGSGFGGSPGGGMPSANIEITPADYDAFERLLGEIQAAFSNEDLNGLRQHVTPEMLSYFSEQLSENASRGVVNKTSNVKLLQGDLAEAWREDGVDYASVAMRFGLVDRTLDRASGRLVEGSETPQEITEVWTFMRAGGGRWLLSAIQQA
ncbi:MAG TPA: TIM44-like domain-containing protein [Xanthobacteraceae bacterium]|jgi:predicted lipid-binding transport protein (Tim44 family)|nr:TIM44-like domain-containing protein [Xanthobacteraceae bacterium]